MAQRFRNAARRIAAFALLVLAMVTVGGAAGAVWLWTDRIAPQLAGQPHGAALKAVVTAPHVLVRRVGARVDYECHCPHPVRFDELSPAFVQVLVGTEDRAFWRHGGVDWRALARAAYVNVASGGTRQGGSTLPQQLVKLKLLSAEKTIERKILEAVLAREVSALLSKEELLAAYANAAWFARGVVGVEAAARRFFAKTAGDLNLWESAVLVGMLKAPSRYHPVAHPEAAAERARTVLGALAAQGLVAPEEVDRAIRIGVQPGSAPPLDTEFRWYLDEVRAEFEAAGETPRPGAFMRASLFLDVLQQQAAQALVRSAAPHQQSAIVSTELDGRVRAVVGGRDYGARQWNLALQERRQAASLAKIPAVAVALRNGYAPWSTVMDAPLRGSWPRNGSRRHLLAPVSIRHAFAQSLNAPFAQLVAREIDDGVARMRNLIRVCLPDLDLPHVEGLVTGSFDLTPWQASRLVASFTTGRCVTPRTIHLVTDARGRILHAAPSEAGQALLPQATAGMIQDLMRDAVRHGTGRAADIPGAVVHGKTGTSGEDRHAWFAGYADGGPLSLHWLASDKASRRVTGTDAAKQFRAFQEPVLRARHVLSPPLPPARPREIRPWPNAPAIVAIQKQIARWIGS
jgi:penicillin-binding protein 1A